MKRTIVSLGVVAVMILVASCKEGPIVGEFNVVLTTPNSDDGAIQFIATATDPKTITSATAVCTGCKLFLVKISETQYKGVLTGPILAGPVFSVGVSDSKATSSYGVTVQAVSNRQHVTRGSVTGYSFALSK